MKKLFLLTIAFGIFFTGLYLISQYKAKLNSKYSLSKSSTYLPDNARRLLDDGIENIQSKQNEKAITKFKELITLYPNLSAGYYNLGLAYVKNNDLNAAIQVWNKAIKINNKYANVYYNLGLAYKLTNDRKKAVSNLAKYLLCLNEKKPQSILKEIEDLKSSYVGTGNVGKILFSDIADNKKLLIGHSKIIYKLNTKEIYSEVELVNLPTNADFKALWTYNNFEIKDIPVNSTQVKVSGSKKILLSIKKPVKNWPTGEYYLKIYINNKLSANAEFYIID